MSRKTIKNSDSVEDYLDLQNPPLHTLLRCDDVQAQWRNKNKKLVHLFSKKQVVHKMIDVLQTSKDFQTERHILGLCISPNMLILQKFVEEIDLTEHLIDTLNKTQTTHRYVFGIIMQIMLKAFDTWPEDLIGIFSKSLTILPTITNSLQYPAVFHFASRFVPRLNNDITFIWTVYASLMDEHGTGNIYLHDINQETAKKMTFPRLNPIQRQKALEVLCIYFNEFGNRSELFYLVSKALPLILQDASDDLERAIVLRLGLNIEPNEALGYSVLSVINCFKSSDILVQYSLLYVAAWNVMIGNKYIEFFVYRLLKRPANNFVLIACAAMIRSVLEVDRSNTELSRNLIQIIDNAFLNNPYTKSNMMQAFRTELAVAASGAELDPESPYCAKLLQHPKKIESEINQNLIAEFQITDQKILQNNDLFVPEFNVRNLWKNQETSSKMTSLFKTITRLPHLPSVSPIGRPLPSPAVQSPLKTSGAFTKKSNSQPIYIPKRVSHSDDEEKIDDEDETAEFHTLDPPPRKPLVITGNLKPPTAFVIENDEEFEEEEEIIFELPEVEVNESLSTLSKLSNEYPNADEPIPTEELAKGQKPIPKINPESPRTGKPLFLRENLFNDDKKPEKPPPIIIPTTPPRISNDPLLQDSPNRKNTKNTKINLEENEEEMEYEYEYEYVDESPEKISPEKKKILKDPELVELELDNFEETQSPAKKKVHKSPSKQKELLLQLDLNNVDEMPVPKPKVVMHRRVLIIEVPERKPSKLFIQQNLVVERPEIISISPKKLEISQTPRVFCNYDDTQVMEEEHVEIDNEHFIEDIITF